MTTPLLDAAYAVLALVAALVCVDRHRSRQDLASALLGLALLAAGLLAVAHAVAHAGQAAWIAIDPAVPTYLVLLGDLVALLGVGLAARHDDRLRDLRPATRLVLGLGALGFVALLAEGVMQVAPLLPPLAGPDGGPTPLAVGVAVGGPGLAGLWALGAGRQRLRLPGRVSTLHGPLFAAAFVWLLGPMLLLVGEAALAGLDLAGAAARPLGAALVLGGLLGEQARRHRETAASLRDLDRLHGATRALLATADPPDAARTAAVRACDVAGADAAVVFRLDPRVQVLRSIGQAGAIAPPTAAALELPLSRMRQSGLLVGLAVRSEDLPSDPLLPFADGLRDGLLAARLHGMLAVPLPLADRGGHLRAGDLPAESSTGRASDRESPAPDGPATDVAGALAVLWCRPHSAGAGEAERLAALAAQVAVAIARARAIDGLGRRAHDDEALIALATRHAAAARTADAMADAAGVARTLLGADHLAVFRRDGELLYLCAESGWPEAGRRTATVTPHSLVGAAVGAAAPVRVDDLALDRRGAATSALIGATVRSGLAAAIGDVGVVAALHRWPEAFGDEEARVLAILGAILLPLVSRSAPEAGAAGARPAAAPPGTSPRRGSIFATAGPAAPDRPRA